MRKMRKLSIFFIMLITYISITSTIAFASSFSSEITIDKKEIKSSDEIEIILYFDNFIDLKKGINSFKGKIDYDSNIFEKITIDNFKTINNWESLLFNPNINEFIAINKSGINQKEDVLKIRLKVKNGLLAGQTSISVKNLMASDGKKDINAKDSSITLNLIEKQNGQPISNIDKSVSSDGNENKNLQLDKQKNTDKTTATDTNNITKDKEDKFDNKTLVAGDKKIESDKEKVSEKKKLVGNNLKWNILSLFILIIILIVIFFIWKNKKHKQISMNNKKHFMLMILISAIVSLQLSNVVYAMTQKGELNGDKEINYVDVTLLQQQLIDLKLLPKNLLENADMNSDGRLTVTDLSLLIQKIENNLDYEVKIYSTIDKYYVEKGESINLKFNADVSHNGEISQIVINGQEHSVKKLENSNEYSVEISGYDKAGIHNFNISQVKLNEGKVIKIDFNEKVEVLKDIPTIKGYEAKDLINEGKVQISFNVEDIDKSISYGSMKLITKEGIEITKKDITAGNNSFDAEVEENKDYKVAIEVLYNRDSDKLIEHESDNTGKILIEKDIKLVIDYRLDVNNLTLHDSQYNKNIVFSKGEEINLGFESTNSTKFVPEKVKVNGTLYSVEQKDKQYIVKLNPFDEAGEREIKIEEIQLSNGKKIEVKNNNTVEVNIKKTVPTISDIVMEENVEDNEMDISFNVNDSDKSLKKLKMVLYDSSKNIIFQDEIIGEKYSKKVSLGDRLTDHYTLKIFGDYNLSLKDEEDIINKELYVENKEAKTRVIVEESNVSKRYLEKGEDLKLTYKIKSNKASEIKGIIVSNIEVPVSKKSDDNYTTTIQVGNKSGKQKVILSKIIFEDDTIVDVNKSEDIEILKSEPYIHNFKAEDDYNNSKTKFSFDIKDLDNSFMSGKVQLLKKDGSIWREEDIKSAGHYETTFDVVEKIEYDFKVNITYKRDEDSNRVVDSKEVLNKYIQMIIDYKLNVSNLETYDINNVKTSYVDRNSDIKLRFTSTNSTKFIPEKIIVNSKEYLVQSIGNDVYEASLNGFDSSGVKEIKIEKIIMNNTKELEVTKDNKAQVEVLKLKPTVDNFRYETLNNGDIRIYFAITDSDEAIIKSSIIVNDGTSDIYINDKLDRGINHVDFTPNHNEKYSIKVISDYDLDTNTIDESSNKFINEMILNQNIEFSQEAIELKDIEKVTLYRKEENDVIEVKDLDTRNFNAQDYIAQIKMRDVSDFYAEIKGGRIDNDNFMLELKYDNGVSYDGNAKSNTITVSYGKVQNNIVKNISFEDIVNTIKNDPTAEITLTHDLDAASISSKDNAMITTEFKGKLNGNGYSIKNLKKSLFNATNGATIQNLIIENATLTSSQGILSNSINNTRVDNVHIKNSSILVESWQMVGAFTGVSNGNSSIENSSISNVTVQGGKHTGGVVGFAKDNFTIRNSYIDGSVTITSDAAGGVIGQVSGTSTIENSYANITFNVNGDWAHGGIVGYSNGATVVLKNSISLADGKIGKRVIGSGWINATNSYEISESKLVSNSGIRGITTISKNDIKDEFFTKELKWNNSTWNLSNINSENMPKLKNLDLNYFEESNKPIIKPTNPKVYIPNMGRLKKLATYDANKEIAYHNMYILMPFYDSKLYVDYGNKLNEDDILNKIKIKTIIPYDANGKFVVGLNSNNYNSISSIKVIFEDDQVKDYKVTFKRMLSDVSTYKIDSLGIGYTYNKFTLKTNISIVDEIIRKAEAMDYKRDIEAVTPGAESRLYVDYYNSSVKNRLREVVTNILESQDDYNLYLDNDILKSKVKNELFTNHNLEKFLYTYNYYDKWYNTEFGGARLSDIIFFNVKNVVNKKYDIKEISRNTISQNGSIRQTGNTIGFYNNVIKPQTNNLSIKEFLEYYIKTLTGYKTGDEWFSNNFKGMLNEKGVKGKEDEINYRAWTLINNRNNLLLPILSAPQKDMYIISVPSQLVIGSLNRYQQYINGDIKGMENLIDNYATKISNFYSTSSSFIDNSPNILNGKTHIQYDTRFSFPNKGDQNPGRSDDSVIKWVYEAIGSFGAANGSGAYANGTDVYWIAYAALGGDFSFKVFTHETAHNQDGYYFYEGKSRRYGTWAEDHADANIAQDLDDGSLVFNLRGDFNITDDVSNNRTLERINSKDKIHSYYKEMFETYYVLDYLTAQAFLNLSPDQQSKLATQVSYPKADNQDQGGGTTKYSKLSADEFRNMNLKNMEDLWDNKIVFRDQGTIGDGGSYGGDNHYNIYWYQPHNDNGRPDSYSFKRLGFEMLGVGGYTNGYVAYRSTMSNNDLEALRIATNDPNITWKEYKLNRFKTISKNLEKIPYFDINKAIKLYEKSLIQDALAGNRNQTNNVRRVLYGIVKRATNDFEGSTIYEINNVTEISTAQQLIQAVSTNLAGNYRLVSDLDFSSIDVSAQDSYIINSFIGTLDGNGFTIRGLRKPLIKKMVYANIKNINVESPIYPLEAKAALIEEAKNSMIDNIKINNSNIKLPIVGIINGSLQQSGDIKVNVVDNEISSINDLIKINEDKTGIARKMKYKLTKDIDASTITSQNFIITGIFTGEIDGNGHKIYNQKKPLIEELKGNISNIKFEDATLGTDTTNYVGVISGKSTNANIENITLNNIIVRGRDNVSALTSYATNTNINRVTATNINITGRNFYAGGLIGRSFSTNVSNVVVSGDMTITKTHNGGIIGGMNGGAIENAYVNVKINRPRNDDNRNQNGGLIGTFENRRGTIKNSIAVADVNSDVYKVIAAKDDNNIADIKNNIQNVYEISDTKGLSSVVEEANNIIAIHLNELKKKTFYINNLKWNSDLWDLSKVESGGMPAIN